MRKEISKRQILPEQLAEIISTEKYLHLLRLAINGVYGVGRISLADELIDPINIE